MDSEKIKKFNKLSNSRTRSEVAKANNKRGKNGERYFAECLSDLSGMKFTRIPSSGAMLGQKNRDRIYDLHHTQVSSMLGDLFAPGKMKYQWIVECKNYSNMPFKKLSKNQCPAILKGWIKDELEFDTISYLLYKDSCDELDLLPLPMLAFKIKRVGNWICYNKDYYQKLGIKDFDPEFEIMLMPDQKLVDIGFGTEYYIEDFKKFIEKNKNFIFLER